MSSSPVWVQLYYEGEDEPVGHSIKIRPIPEDVADLIKAAKTELSPDIDHAPPSRIFVYPPDTDPPFSQANSIRPGKKLKELIDELKNTTPPTSDDHPLIVVATDPQKQSQQNNPILANALQNLSISLEKIQDATKERKAACRMWTGDPTVYNLKATSYQDFDTAVRAKYTFLDDEENISYYVIKQKRDVSSRAYISNDDELNSFFDLAGKPTIFIWPRGSPSLSPASLPSEIEIHLSSAESVSESSGSSRGYMQKLFRQAVRKRDRNMCVLSGEVLRPKAGNVEAAHIFGIEGSLSSQRDAAGVLNAYDTWNGMLLEKSLHVAFDAYHWCMDEFLVVHVSDEGKSGGLQQWDGKQVRLSVGSPLFPSRELLQARFALYKERQRGGKTSGKTGSGPKTL